MSAIEIREFIGRYDLKLVKEKEKLISDLYKKFLEENLNRVFLKN
jgi:hypothetical protein